MKKIFLTSVMSRRFFHVNKMAFAPVQTSSLAKLRKSTGYSMSNCKKALQLHADLKMAEKWLHEEARRQGWLKIANLEHKIAAQGLIGVCIRDRVAAMVEVNCETDFVAKNVEFQSFVSKVLTSCLNYVFVHGSGGNCTKLFLDDATLTKLPANPTNLGDLTAAAIGKFGEKAVIRRAVCFRADPNIILSSFSHPLTSCPNLENGTLGKYGGMIAFSPTSSEGSGVSREYLSDLGRQLSQHIVGMNPTKLGNIKDIKPAILEPQINDEELGAKLLEPEHRKDDIVVDGNLPDSDEIDEDSEMKEHEQKLVDTNEDRLIHQQFLLDPSMRVGEFLLKHSLEVVDFQRFECGEIII